MDVRRECADVLVSLKSLFELIASNRPKPDPTLLKKLQLLKRDHENLVDELARNMARVGPNSESGRGAATAADAFDKVERSFAGHESIGGSPPSASELQSTLDVILDREASLRAQYDLLVLKLDRMQNEHRDAAAQVEKFKRDLIEKDSERQELLGKHARELEEFRAVYERRLDSATRFIGVLADRARLLESILDARKPVLQYALTEELDLYRQEEVFLNPALLGGSAPSQKHAAKLVRMIEDSGLFDRAYYQSQFEGGVPRGMDLLNHYVTKGWREGKSPQPLFSVPFYLMRNPDLARDGIEPLSHYIEHGSKERRDPHPLFCTDYYAGSVETPPSGTTWLGRFLEIGPSPPSPHPLFDAAAYSRKAGLSDSHTTVALLHYVTSGWRARKFGFLPLFDPDYYEAQLGRPAGMEPYLHYAIFGAAHGISPHPLFSTAHYLESTPALDPLRSDPLLHYLLHGEREDRQPSPFFSPQFYRRKYLGGKASSPAILHYLTAGMAAQNDPHPYFDAAGYAKLAQRAGSPAAAATSVACFVTDGLRHLPSETIVGFFRTEDSAQVPVTASAASVTPPAPSLISKQFPGKVAYRDGAPNVLLIAHIAGDHLFGSERSFLDMVDAIGRIPTNLYVVLPRNVPDYTNAIRPHCHRVYIVDYKWWRKGEAMSARSTEAFEQIIRSDRIDAVHVNTIMLREPLEAARKCGVPGIVHVRELIQHDQALQDLIGEAPDEIIRQTKARADWVIGNSEITGIAFAKEDRTFTIPNTIDVDTMDIANEVSGEIKFGLISSNVPKKGIADVVELARLAAARVKNATFVIIGPENDLVKELKAKQAAGQLPRNIQFPGYATTPRQAVEQVNVVLNFSHFAESFGRTVLEAMAARRPVIGYHWGALPELIDHGKSGYLVDFKQYAEALPHVEKLCRNPQLIRELGERGREIAVTRFALPSYRAKTAEAYARIVPPREVREAASAPLVREARLPGLKRREARPRVAYFCWHFPVPSETFVLNELESLVAQGADVIVFCRQTPWKDFKPSFPITFERVDSPQKLAQRLTETGRTIVHAHFVYPVVTDMVWPACEQAKIPFTFIAHAQDIFRYDNDQKNRLAEIGKSPWCRALFTLSKFHLDFVVERGFPREKVIINPNAVDTSRFSAAYDEDKQSRSARKIISIHRFVKKKGLDLLIRAAPMIEDLGVRIEIYGYGDLEQEYRNLIAEVGARNVEIMGQLSQDEIVGKMKTADLFAAPSVRIENGDMDGIPTSVVESMAAGVPVLTTNVAGIPDLVIDGITGIMVEPTPESVAAGIRRYYEMPSLKVRAIIRAAAQRARERHDVVRLTRVLTRVWRNETIDIIIVSWNNLAELKMVVQRILENTSLPYHLIICDNQSRREPVAEYLDALWQAEERVTVIHNNVNAMVGPGTNAALAQGTSDYAIYICGKEGVSFARGWEITVVHALEEQPEAGLVGTIGYSPTYLHGAQLPTGIELFPKFRNKEFAKENPTRLFGHVQGGLFGMRRKMVDQIGGFSDDVPHNYTDVEYSYYAESRGWKLGTVPGMLALFNKSRPTLSQRFDETVMVAHPVLPDELARYDAVANGRLKHCNLCDWYGEAFVAADCCPSCGCTPEDRTVYRWLSDSILMYRRLPALGVGLHGAMEKEWGRQFQGARMSMKDMIGELKSNGRLPNRAMSFHLALLRCTPALDDLELAARELKRLVMRGGTALVQIRADGAIEWQPASDRLKKLMASAGFRLQSDEVYTSKAVDYTFVPMSVFEKI
ncbi:glycosyltransferase [Bradyrhizobium sp. ORS 375]|uniref:glycosyltransferase n=1 Tax=Bradyrhizobium sp. (strain ORS 375) TaxID=566679 RepID=UPI001584F2C3|nr:glycosyltransferase [Bradyrhizobium sp. ORS 375]